MAASKPRGLYKGMVIYSNCSEDIIQQVKFELSPMASGQNSSRGKHVILSEKSLNKV